MLDIAEARRLVLDRVRPLAAETVPLDRALDRVLAVAVRAEHDAPPWDNSAMDGFAAAPGPAGERLAIVGESRAGAPYDGTLHAGEAVRISTGAVLPAGAGAVVMVERTTEHDDGTVTLDDERTPGRNVRGRGEDFARGDVLLEPGTPLGPAEVGAAAAANVATLEVARAPRVAVLSTGDELVEPGTPLRDGQIPGSNAVALTALARRAGADVVAAATVPDDPDVTRTAIAAALAEADVVVVSGGVSVGPHDHVKPALEALGVEEGFWRVALRPGKPTWFGTRGETLVLGLPGNPVSAVVTFLLFARPALRALQGAPPGRPRIRARLTVPVARSAGRDELVRVTLDGGRATPTGPQGSHVLTSLLGADGLALVPRGDGDLPAGTEVAVELL